MKLKKFLPLALSLVIIPGLASCSSEAEPVVPVDIQPEEFADYSINLSLPAEYRTRAAADGTVGSDGLYTFTRDVNKLWYGVYIDGEILYCSEDQDVEQATVTDDGFALNIKLHKEQDPTKVNVFFWAGSTDDAVVTTKTGAPSFNDANTKIDINYAAGCVTVSPRYINGDNTVLKEYDSFAGYFQLAPTADQPTDVAQTFTLKRPFAQIHVLTDELTYPAVAAAYPNGIAMQPGFGAVRVNKDNVADNLKNPTTWFFKSSQVGGQSYAQNNLWFGQDQNYYEFTNMVTGTTPERVTFKGRKMDYLGCYLVFAPQTKQPLKNGSDVYGYFNLGFKDANNLTAYSEFSYVKLPAAGIKANERYVIYNHYNDPTDPGSGGGGGGGEDPDPDPDPDPDGGNGGFISNCFTFEVITSPTWDGTVEQQK